jgi:hypothetical protein
MKPRNLPVSAEFISATDKTEQAEAMSDFAVWLRNLDPTRDPDLQALRDFANANAAEWPYGSNDVGDYIAVVSAHAADVNRNSLLATLARYFATWKSTGQTVSQGFWARILTGVTDHLGVVLLALFGVLVAAILTIGIFYGNFLSSIAKPEQARGLITFLFSVSTIAIFLLIAVATFYMDKTQLGDRFDKAKDVLTLMIGIFGTILGFYYGSLANPTGEGGAMRLANIEVSSVEVAPDEKTTVTATVLGGIAPITYDLYFSDLTGKVKTDTLTVKDKPVTGGAIAQPVTIPADVKKPTAIIFTLGARDAKGNQAQGTGTLLVVPKSP